MTTNPNMVLCPECGETAGMPLTAGAVLCLVCRHEWKPGAPTLSGAVDDDLAGPITPVSDSPGTETAPEGTAGETSHSFHPPVDPDVSPATEGLDTIVADMRDKLVGRSVFVFESEQWATVTDITEDADLRVEYASGLYDVIGLDDYDTDDVRQPVDADDATVASLGATVLTVAALCLRCGLQSITRQPDGTTRLIDAPVGWLPQDVDAWPIIESGVAYAIATLIHLYQLDTDQVLRVADTYTAGAEASAGRQT